MADEQEDDLELVKSDAGTSFRLEMALSNFILGYWMYIVATVVVFLIGVFAYGQMKNMTQKAQRHASAEIAKIEATLPAPLIALPDRLQSDPTFVSDADLGDAARKLEAVGAEAGGAASAEAWLKAAELYRLADDAAARRAALEHAADAGTGALHYAAVAGLANLDLEEGQGDRAVSRLKELTTDDEEYLAQQASLDLGLALEHLDRDSEAAQVYQTFLDRWPESPDAAEVTSRRDRVQGG